MSRIDLPPVGIARHEQLADRVVAGLGQLEAEFVGNLDEELVRDLHQDAGAVTGARIGADRAAMLEIAENGERVVDDLVRLAAFDIGDEADAAGILVERRIVKTLRLRQPDAPHRRSAPRSSSQPSLSSPPHRAGASFHRPQFGK